MKSALTCHNRYDPEHHVLVIDLPEGMDGKLFGEGEYTLEVLRGKLSRIKLRERDQEALAGMQTEVVSDERAIQEDSLDEL